MSHPNNNPWYIHIKEIINSCLCMVQNKVLYKFDINEQRCMPYWLKLKLNNVGFTHEENKFKMLYQAEVYHTYIN